MLARVIPVLVTAVVFVAAASQLAGFGHWVQAFDRLGAEPWGRYLVALGQLAALVGFWWPGRRGYGAAGILAVSLAAIIAHLAVLGLSSAPPAVALAILSGWEARQNRRDFQR